MSAVGGIDFTEVNPAGDQKFQLGRRGDENPSTGYKEYVYGRAGANLGAFDVVVFTGTTFNSVMGMTSNRAAQMNCGVGVAVVDVPNGSYGWFQVYGSVKVNTAATAAAGARLFATGTSGQLDDTAGGERVYGISAASGNAGDKDGFVNYPSV